MSTETKSTPWWATVLILGTAMTGVTAATWLGANFHFVPTAKIEPETWCPKRLLGFNLVAERLDLEAFPRAESSAGVLTCKLERKRSDEEIRREVEAKDLPTTKGKKR